MPDRPARRDYAIASSSLSLRQSLLRLIQVPSRLKSPDSTSTTTINISSAQLLINPLIGFPISNFANMDSSLDLSLPSSNQNISTTWSRCEIKVTEIKHRWNIENVMYQDLDTLKSSTFSSSGPDRSRFCLFTTNFGSIDVRLCVLESNEPHIAVKWRLTVYDGNKERFSKVSSHDRLFPSKDFSNTSIINLGVSDKELSRFLDKKGGLTIEAKIGIIEFGSTQTTSGASLKVLTSQHAVESNKKVMDDLAAIYESRKMSDVTLVVGGKEIPAHKFILATRSPVFEAMFSHETIEKKESKVVIEDVDLEVFELLLKYIYTGKCEEAERHAVPLMVAADLYGLEQLKSFCEQIIASNMTAKMAPKLLLLADTYNAQKLKEKVVQCIQKNTSDVVRLLCKEKKLDELVELFKEAISKNEHVDNWDDVLEEETH